MKKSEELQYCQNVIILLGRQQSAEMLLKSCLTDRERKLIFNKLVKGLSLKECSELLQIEENSVSKALQKACCKLHIWLVNRDTANILAKELRLSLVEF